MGAIRGGSKDVDIAHLSMNGDGSLELKTTYPSRGGKTYRAAKNALGGSAIQPSTNVSGDEGLPARTSALQGDNSILSQNNKTVNPVPESHQGKKLRLKSAESLLDQYDTIDKPMARSADAIENVQRVADAGFTKPGEVEDIIGKVTGANGKVSKMTQTLVSTAKPVDTMTDISNLINSNTSIAGYL